MTLTGDFTLNHLYDFNNQGAAPFGWFGTMHVTNVSGLFAPYINNGSTLSGSSALWTVSGSYPIWNMGGFTFTTTWDVITGADSGRYVFGILNLSGNGYNQSSDFASWNFIAPPYDISHFYQDITGPITLYFVVGHENGHVPDRGGTILMFGLSVACIVSMRFAMGRRVRA
jgi:hypothetical protein